MEVGELISFFRKQSGMTIDELAAKSGVPKGTLNKIIGGVTKAPTLDNMKSIAKALGKTLADFDESPIETKNSPSTAEAAPGEDVQKMLEILDESLVKMGYIVADDDLTEQQEEVLIGICRILRATFKKK